MFHVCYFIKKLELISEKEQFYILFFRTKSLFLKDKFSQTITIFLKYDAIVILTYV